MTPKLFNPAYNNEAEELKRYMPVNVNLAYETVSSHLALAEETYILPLLGSALFTRIVSYYNQHPTLSVDSADTTLIEKVRFAVVRIAIWKGYDVISANISDIGIATSVEKENRLYRYQEENIKSTLKNEGFDHIDNILTYLESNIGTFTEFASSEYYTSINTSLIRNTRQFNECYNIGSSRLVFLKMRQYVRDVELIKLSHRIGTAFYNELLTANESLPKYAAILPNIRRFVVYQAVADGIGELHKMPTEKGLVFENETAEGFYTSTVERVQLEDTIRQFSDKALLYLDSAINHIKINKSDYPAYTAFAGDSPADGIIHFDNNNSKIFMA